jgi:hypothetical protein
MAVLVVFESMFENTKVVADAVAQGLARHLRVEQVEVGAAPAVIGDEVELLGTGSRARDGRSWTERPVPDDTSDPPGVGRPSGPPAIGPLHRGRPPLSVRVPATTRWRP